MLLMTPGPIEIDERVIEAAHRPAVYHQTLEFFQTMDDTIDLLRAVFRTKSDVIVMPGSGRLGLEAAICSVIERGDPTLHLHNGAFSGFSLDIARRSGAETTVLESRWGGPLNLDAVRAALKAKHYKLLLMVQSETSTGAYYSVSDVADLCREFDTLCFVDGISSIGSLEFEMDEMGADLAVGASHKCVGALMGLSMIGVSEKAYAAMRARRSVCQSYALDLLRWKQLFFGRPAPRPYPVIPSPHLVLALQEACRLAVAEGMPARWQRHHRFAEATRQAVESIGLSLYPDRDLAADSVTAVRLPDGVTEKALLERMADAYQVMIGGSLWGITQGKLFRISHMSVQASRDFLAPTLEALESSLDDLGYRVEKGRALAAFDRALEG
ncbi:MAG: alanine--glyoxylate aminotransferase family protein [Chloroflexi bacterium]|nr:alanine--glyoxylate aminotransferase family protein [Chloroflexota bacterium]MCL5108822.1 alanine--glyoxylate aminotransferase family protein [Chloroflexota bacterium]MDA8218106.1 alanine--glyoxylate aminotransferase family protein [Dehalococcoidales bacterium]